MNSYLQKKPCQVSISKLWAFLSLKVEEKNIAQAKKKEKQNKKTPIFILKDLWTTNPFD